MRDRAEEMSGAKAARTVKMATGLAGLRGVVSSSFSRSVWAPPLQGCSPRPPGHIPAKPRGGSDHKVPPGRATALELDGGEHF